MSRSPAAPPDRPENLTDRIYTRLKQDIFTFHFIPGERFTETEIATRMSASRTPVREALNRLQRDGFVEVHFRSGWQIKSFDFREFEQLYDVRIILELAAVDRLCREVGSPDLADLKRVWLIDPADRLTDGNTVRALDERFHEQLVEASGNTELVRIHREITERIRIIRHLDFTKCNRIESAYDDHGRILRHILLGQATEARALLRSHIETSKAEVRKITLHMLHEARIEAPAHSNSGIDDPIGLDDPSVCFPRSKPSYPDRSRSN